LGIKLGIGVSKSSLRKSSHDEQKVVFGVLGSSTGRATGPSEKKKKNYKGGEGKESSKNLGERNQVLNTRYLEKTEWGSPKHKRRKAEY